MSIKTKSLKSNLDANIGCGSNLSGIFESISKRGTNQ